jgi:hypothetical protein
MFVMPMHVLRAVFLYFHVTCMGARIHRSRPRRLLARVRSTPDRSEAGHQILSVCPRPDERHAPTAGVRYLALCTDEPEVGREKLGGAFAGFRRDRGEPDPKLPRHARTYTRAKAAIGVLLFVDSLDDFAAKAQSRQAIIDACEHDFQKPERDMFPTLGRECTKCQVRELPWLQAKEARFHARYIPASDLRVGDEFVMGTRRSLGLYKVIALGLGMTGPDALLQPLQHPDHDPPEEVRRELRADKLVLLTHGRPRG